MTVPSPTPPIDYAALLGRGRELLPALQVELASMPPPPREGVMFDAPLLEQEERRHLLRTRLSVCTDALAQREAHGQVAHRD